MQAEKEYNFQQMTEATQAQQQAEQVAVRDKQRADDLQHQLAAAQQEQQRCPRLYVKHLDCSYTAPWQVSSTVALRPRQLILSTHSVPCAGYGAVSKLKLVCSRNPAACRMTWQMCCCP